MTRHYLITGGAGFIGSNYVNRLLSREGRVTVLDNLSRNGAHHNLKWLRETHGDDAFELIKADVRDADALARAASGVDVIVHLAGQVAVTSSVLDPRTDFECNATGTLNMLEAARGAKNNPIVLYASTNKVYGGMEEIRVVEGETRYQYADLPFGIPETQPLDFHSPYGCSKGAGDQYTRDYYRIYQVPSVVLRQSCIYGPRQFGVEDQGWVAWFILAAMMGKTISIYGDGKQVRDILFIEDLLDAYDSAIAQIDVAAGKVYNIGGGPDKVLSVWKEFGPLLEGLFDRQIPTVQGDWRPGDQRIYVSDIRKAENELGWKPKTRVAEGIQRLFQWAKDNRPLFE